MEEIYRAFERVPEKSPEGLTGLKCCNGRQHIVCWGEVFPQYDPDNCLIVLGNFEVEMVGFLGSCDGSCGSESLATIPIPLEVIEFIVSESTT